MVLDDSLACLSVVYRLEGVKNSEGARMYKLILEIVFVGATTLSLYTYMLYAIQKDMIKQLFVLLIWNKV